MQRPFFVHSYNCGKHPKKGVDNGKHPCYICTRSKGNTRPGVPDPLPVLGRKEGDQSKAGSDTPRTIERYQKQKLNME